jgi:hypothetical protein
MAIAYDFSWYFARKYPPRKPPELPVDPRVHLQILRDHWFVEEVNVRLHGMDRLLERTSRLVFAHHLPESLEIPRLRQRWKVRGEMVSSDENRYCVGCCWRVDESLYAALKILPPSITRNQAVEYIESGRRTALRRRRSLGPHGR